MPISRYNSSSEGPPRPTDARRRDLKSFVADTRGAVTLIAGLAFPVLIGFAALSLEYGHGLVIRVENQRIADLASYAGASAYQKVRKANGAVSEAKVAAEEAAKSLALLNGIDAPVQVEVTFLNSDQVESALLEEADGVQVEVREERELMLARVLDAPEALNINTLAVAGFFRLPHSGACILGLDTTEVGIFVNGNVHLEMPGCAIASSGAMKLTGSVTINSACISPTEPSKTDACELGWSEGGPFEDPYSGFVGWPGNDAFCDHPPGTLKNAAGGDAALNGGVLAQGVHCINSDVNISGNITLSAEGPVTLVFSPGTHLKITGNPVVKLYAPTSGDLKGVLIHAPASDIQVAGTVDLAIGCEGLVARTIKFSGTVDVAANCTAEDQAEIRDKLTSIRLIR